MLKKENNRDVKRLAMIEVGRLFVKTAGRDAGKKGLIVNVMDSSFVMVDGQVRRKKCNIRHIEPLDTLLKITMDAPHEEVVSELKKIGIEVKEKSKERKERVKEEPAKKGVKKAAKKK